MLLSIVIVSWNSKDLTLKCLSSIYNSKDALKLGEQLEVIVVDNNSADGSPDEIKQQYPQVKLVCLNDNTGYATASNIGMHKASGKYTLLLGSDTEITGSTLTGCIEFLDKNEEAAAVTCRLIYPDGSEQGHIKKFPTILNGIFTYTSLNFFNKSYDMTDFDYTKVSKVEQPATTFLMVRSEVLESIGYFDEQYKILYNDVDLCQRINKLGGIYFIPEGLVKHHGSHSTKKATASIRKTMYGDILRYYKNNFGAAGYILYPILALRYIMVSLKR